MKVYCDVSCLDEYTSFLASLPGKYARARNSALSTIGFNLKNRAKAAVNNNSLGWPQLSNLTIASKMNPTPNKSDGTPRLITARNNTEAKAGKAWGSLAGLLSYKVNKEKGELLFGLMPGIYGKRLVYTIKGGVGGSNVNGSHGGKAAGTKVFIPNVITETIISLARKLTVGFESIVSSPQQQRYFYVLGTLTGHPWFFKIGHRFKVPARPLIGPVVVAARNDIPEEFYEKFWERLRHYESLV